MVGCCGHGNEYSNFMINWETVGCSKRTMVHGVTWLLDMKSVRIIYFFSNYQLNAQFLYSLTIYMLHYNPRHVSSSTMHIFRRSSRIITASGIVTLCKRLYSKPVESRLSLLSTGLLYSRLKRVTMPDAVIIRLDFLKMCMVLLETCRGL